MRRLWAHIIIAFTCIVSSLAAFPTVLKSMTTNGDYETRRQFTFQLTERESEDTTEIHELTDSSAKDMAAIMETRLEQAGVSSYEITTSGKDIVNVAFSADNSSLYNQITTYLGFSGSFALMNSDPDSEPIPAKDFLNGKAYLKEASTNEYPTIIIPINTTGSAYAALIEWARNNPVAGEEDSEGNTSADTAPVYIIYNYVKGDTYKTLTDNNQFNDKILLTFDALDDSTLYYDDNKNSFSYVCGYQDSNGNGYADPEEVKYAYDQANFLYNLFDASALDYDVKVIRGLASGTEVWVSAAVEPISQFAGKLSWNSTLTAVVAAIIIITLLLVFFYRLGALSVVTTTITSTFLAFLFMVITGLEYNILAVIAFALVAFLSILSGVIYIAKLKEESYRGRTLKKANSEAARKSTLPIADIHVVSVVIGLLLYLLGGTALHTFSSILVLGSLVSALINLLGLRAMMWLATNTTGLTGKYEVFGIDADKVPDHMADEKQSFYGAYADKDFTNKKKPTFIVGASLFVVALVGLITMGALNGGNLFRSPASRVTGSEIYISETIKVLDDETSKFDEDAVHEILGNMKVYTQAGETVTWDETDTHKTLDSYATKVSSFSVSDSKTVEGTTTNYLNTYFDIVLSATLDQETTYLKIKGYDAGADLTIREAFEIYFEEINLDYSTSVSNSIELKTIYTFSNVQNPKWDKVFLATSIAIAALTLYFLLRYRLSRGLAMLAFPVVGSVINLGIFVLLSAVGLSLPASILVSVPVVSMFSFFFMVIIANKERDMVIEDKVKDKSYEHRSELSKRALGIAMTPVFATIVLGAYLFVNFFGFGPGVTSYLFLACLIGVIISVALVIYGYIPLSNIFYKWFSNINFEPKPRKSKKGNAPAKKKSAEPEEAIFIGIND